MTSHCVQHMVDVCHCIRTENDCTLVYMIVHKHIQGLVLCVCDHSTEQI